jgi:hypothetical protein
MSKHRDDEAHERAKAASERLFAAVRDGGRTAKIEQVGRLAAAQSAEASAYLDVARNSARDLADTLDILAMYRSSTRGAFYDALRDSDSAGANPEQEEQPPTGDGGGQPPKPPE